ncbi:MAG: hypothetical protein OCC45_05380 [Desulfotalea sp.]
MRVFEFAPLSFFLFYIRFVNIETSEGWDTPFLVSGILAFISIIVFLTTKNILNRLFLGINLYFISGALAIITNQWWLNKIYGDLHASGMLAWIVVVGILSYAVTPYGFIGVDTPDKKSMKQNSLILLVTSVVAFFISFYSKESQLFGEMIPFVILFSTNYYLQKRIVK